LKWGKKKDETPMKIVLDTEGDDYGSSTCLSADRSDL